MGHMAENWRTLESGLGERAHLELLGLGGCYQAMQIPQAPDALALPSAHATYGAAGLKDPLNGLADLVIRGGRTCCQPQRKVPGGEPVTG
jgi:hypothetical protein